MFKWIKRLFSKEEDYTWIGYEVSWTNAVIQPKTFRDRLGRFTAGNQFGKKKGKKNGKN